MRFTFYRQAELKCIVVSFSRQQTQRVTFQLLFFILVGDFVRQACGSLGDLSDGAEPLTYIEHLFDCVSMIAAYTISSGNVTYSTK